MKNNNKKWNSDAIDRRLGLVLDHRHGGAFDYRLLMVVEGRARVSLGEKSRIFAPGVNFSRFNRRRWTECGPWHGSHDCEIKLNIFVRTFVRGYDVGSGRKRKFDSRSFVFPRILCSKSRFSESVISNRIFENHLKNSSDRGYCGIHPDTLFCRPSMIRGRYMTNTCLAKSLNRRLWVSLSTAFGKFHFKSNAFPLPFPR